MARSDICVLSDVTVFNQQQVNVAILQLTQNIILVAKKGCCTCKVSKSDEERVRYKMYIAPISTRHAQQKGNRNDKNLIAKLNTSTHFTVTNITLILP